VAQSTRSLLFDGIDGRVTGLNRSTIASAAALSVSFWVKPDATQPSPSGRIFQCDDAGQFYFLLQTGSTGLQFGFKAGALTLSATLTAGAWNHVAARWDGTTARLYLNGAQVDSGSSSGALASGGSIFELGDRLSGGRAFKGGIDDCFVWASDIGSTSVAGIAAGTADPATLSPGFSWRLEEGSGTATADGSGGGNTGTLSGGVSWSADVPSQLAGGGGGVVAHNLSLLAVGG
jgi:hypothetical protein